MNTNKKKILPSQNLAEKQNHYGIRKLSIGAASVLLGSFFLLTSNDIVKADSTDQTVLTNKNETTGTLSEDEKVEPKDVVTEKPVTEPVSTTKAKTEVPVEPETRKENSTEPGTIVEETKDADSSAVTANNEENANVESKTDAAATSATEEIKLRVRVKRATSTPSENVAEVIDENAKAHEVTLKHGDNDFRVVTVITGAQKNDEITVEVPYIFNPSTDRSVDGKFTVSSTTEKVEDPEFQTDKSFQNTTFTYNINVDASLSFSIILDPTIDDWSFLPAGKEYDLIVKKNGQELQKIKYTIDKPAEITNSEVVMDHNQTSNLVVNEKYPVGISVLNDGSADGTQYSGTITVDVPDGFVVDSESLARAIGLTGGDIAGDEERFFHTNYDSKTFKDNQNNRFKVTQAGPGEKIVIEFHNVNKATLNGSQIGFFGYYQHALEAQDNNFKVSITYHSTDANNDRAKGPDQIYTGLVKNINLAVGDQVNSSLNVSYTVNPNKEDQVDEIFRDKVNENGSHDSDNPYLDYKKERAVQAYNDGNIAQTNVNIHLDIEPGTVLAKVSEGYGINLQTSAENRLASIVVTLTDGRKVSLSLPGTPAGGFTSAAIIGKQQIDQGVAKDGSNIKAIDIVYDNIIPGTKVMASFSNGAILDKNVDEKASYQLSYKSDQIEKKVEEPLVLTVKDPSDKTIAFTGVVSGFENTSYQPTDNISGGNQANIIYVLRNATAEISDPSSYLITIPKGFDISLDDLGAKQYLWQSGPSDLIKEGKVKISDLGKIGLNGEHMFRVDVSFTPSYRRPVYIGLVNPDSPLTITADKNELPSSYDYGLQEV